MSLPKQTRGAESGGVPVQSEHKSGSSLMSSTKKKKRKIKLRMRKNLSVVISESRRYRVGGEHFQFSNLTNGRGKKPFPGPVFNAEKGINRVWVTHNTVKTVSSSLEVRILFVR